MGVLVTGGAGFIGSHVCEALLQQGENVVSIDNFNNYYSPDAKRANMQNCLKNNRFFSVEADIRDLIRLNDVFSAHRIDRIIHLAAMAGVRYSIENPALYFDVNVNGTVNLLNLAVKHNIENFVFASSSSVYGENSKIPFSENDPTENQISPYASSKKAGELICRTYSSVYNLNITCLRFFTVYGPRGRPDMAPYKFTDRIMRGLPIEMYGDGSTLRDYTFISDIVSGIISALNKKHRFEIFNLGNSSPVELSKLIHTIEKSLGKKAVIIERPVPKGDVPTTYADISRAEKVLGFSPRTSIEEGIPRLAEWYIKSQEQKARTPLP